MTELEEKLAEIEARGWKPVSTKSPLYEAYMGWDEDIKLLCAALRLTTELLTKLGGHTHAGCAFCDSVETECAGTLGDILRALKVEA